MTNLKLQIIFIFCSYALQALSPASALGITDDWMGAWLGSCQISHTNSPGVTRQILMQLRVSKEGPGILAWKIQYENEGVRDYKMIRNTSNPTLWVLDEQNGILIDRSFDSSTQTLTDFYTVNERFFISKMKLIGSNLQIESDSYPVNQFRSSGIPSRNVLVRSFSPGTKQICQLTKEEF